MGEQVEVRVWRIEKFQVKAWPKEKYGKFHKGDSYIVMKTYKKGESDGLAHDIHIWIGAESTQDEYGTAAYKVCTYEYFGGSHRAFCTHHIVSLSVSFLLLSKDGGSR
jgi:hypothetical protein